MKLQLTEKQHRDIIEFCRSRIPFCGSATHALAVTVRSSAAYLRWAKDKANKRKAKA